MIFQGHKHHSVSFFRTNYLEDRQNKQSTIDGWIRSGVCKDGVAEAAYEGDLITNYKFWWHYTHVDDYGDCDDYHTTNKKVKEAIPARMEQYRLPEDEEYIIKQARAEVVEVAPAYVENRIVQPAVHITVDLTPFATALTAWQAMI